MKTKIIYRILIFAAIFMMLFTVVAAATTPKTYWDKRAPRTYISCTDSDKGSVKNTPGVVTLTYIKNGQQFKYDVFDNYFNGKLYEKRCDSRFQSGQMTYPARADKLGCGARGSKVGNVVSAGTGKTWKAGACK